MMITPYLHVVPRVTAHPYLLIDPDGLTLIDTGIPGSAGKILNFIKYLGYSPRNLNRILLTHADFDHAGSLAALKKATGARVYASVSEARAIASGRFPRALKTDNILLKPIFALAERLGRISPAHVDEHISEGHVLPVLKGLFVLDTKGHTPGHLSFFSPLLGILFSGDSLVPVGGKMVGSREYVTWNVSQAAASVRKQLALKVRIFCAGHGPVLFSGFANLFQPQLALVPIKRNR